MKYQQFTNDEQDMRSNDVTECRSIETIMNKMQKVSSFIIYKQWITDSILENVDWKKVPQIRGLSNNHHLIISKKRLMTECQNSNPKLPPIAIIMEDSVKHWPDWIKILDIALQGIYVGIRYGYDTKKLLLIIKFIGNELPMDLVTIIIHHSIQTEIKSFVLNVPMSLSQQNGKYDKWVTSIQVRDFDHELNQIADNHKINLNALKRCFDENGVDYSYLDNHSRRELTELLGRYGIKTGPATKIFRSLCGKHSIDLINYKYQSSVSLSSKKSRS